MRWFILLVFFSGSAQAEIFKCVDAAGKKTYQQSPCEPGEAAKGYKFKEESAATKASRDKERKQIAAKKEAKLAARKKYESSAEYRTAVINRSAAKLNAQTQFRRELSDTHKNLQKTIDRGERKATALWGLAAGRR